MKIMRAHLLKQFNRRSVEREVESELHFHLELLTEENLQSGMTQAAAEEEALKRFGNVVQIKNQCVAISKRSRFFMRVLKSFLIVVSLGGVLARISSADVYGKQIGNMLMVIATLSVFLLYLRGLRFSGFVPENEHSSSLDLRDADQMPPAATDREQFTTLERVISGD